MKLFDTLSGATNDLKNQDLKIYACGPTVYNHIHIGNTRPLFLVDTLTRYLETQNINYTYLLNITDVDDKIINKAEAEGVDESLIAKKYTDAFLTVLKAMNIKMPTKIVPISEKMPEMINFIEQLVEKNKAYVANNNVYFDIDQAKNEYGRLSKQKLEALELGSRKEVDLNKKNPLDFALWKKTTKGITWNSPWGAGRPGWHTECTVLIDWFFQDTIDVHVGGIDLKFPHHENERIQFVVQNNKELARNWIYNGHLALDGEKMSKSLGNVITAQEFLEEHEPNQLRYIYLATNYSQPISITKQTLTMGGEWNNKILSLLKNINLNQTIGTYEPVENDEVAILESKFNDYMQDNLNTAMAISVIDKITKDLNVEIRNKKLNINKWSLLKKILDTLGFKYQIPVIDDEAKAEIMAWKKYIKDQDYEKADKVRNKLIEKGII